MLNKLENLVGRLVDEGDPRDRSQSSHGKMPTLVSTEVQILGNSAPPAQPCAGKPYEGTTVEESELALHFLWLLVQVFQSCWLHYLSNKEAELKNHFMASPEKLLVWVSRKNAAGLLISDFWERIRTRLHQSLWRIINCALWLYSGEAFAFRVHGFDCEMVMGWNELIIDS